MNTLTVSKVWSLVLVLTLAVVAWGQPALAQPGAQGNRPADAGPPQDVVDQLLERGFQQVQPSIFERPADGNPDSFETMVFGVDGHLWLLGQQEAYLQFLQERFELFPAAELVDAITAQENLIQGTLDRIAELQGAEAQASGSVVLDAGNLTAKRLDGKSVAALLDAAVNCTTTLGRNASAGATTTGPTATGGSSFSDNCSEVGTVSSTATAQGTDGSGNVNTYTQDCPSKSGTNVSCTATASVSAVSNCFSNSQGSVSFGFSTYTVSDFNSVCRVCTVGSITGSSTIYVPYLGSASGSWTASVSGCESPSRQWYYNNSAVGTGSSYSRNYFHNGLARTVYDTVKLTVTDATGQTKTKTKTVTVVYQPGISDPCLQASVSGISDGLTEQPICP